MNNEVSLRILKVEDVSQEYVNWFNEKSIIEYSDNQYRTFSFETQVDYVRSKTLDINSQLYGIFVHSNHIGNIVLDKIDFNHKRAEITYVVGNKDYWGKGIATLAIEKIIKISREEFQLKKLSASCADKNEGSKRVLLKNGFKIEGVRKKHLFFNEKWFDQVDFGLLI